MDVASGTQADVRVIAHRGASGTAPEHSLQAYLEAIEQGADGVECDVRLTADGHLVCLHDPTVRRLTGGRGRVSDLTLEQLRRLQWHEGAEPLTLRDLFELIFETGRCQTSRGWLEIAVETKHPTRFGARVEEAVCDLVDWFGWLPAPDDTAVDPERITPAGPVSVMSFSTEALRRVRRRSPRLPRVYLLDKPQPAATRATLPGAAGHCGVAIDLVRSEPAWVEAIRSAGHTLWVWTVNTEADAELAVSAGAERLISDHPALVRAHLQTSAGARVQH